MVEKDIKKDNTCPFWSGESLKCRICNGGLFIPLDDHIDVYCTSPIFSQCLQYELHSAKHLEIMQKARETRENRRKYSRIFASYKVTLAKLKESGEIVSHRPTVAKTLDVSKGGMRLVTDIPLTNDTVLQFSFDKTFPKKLQGATGQVTWCHKQIDEPGYQAGVSFQGDHIIEAMGNYLE
jgi:hypothetical protein